MGTEFRFCEVRRDGRTLVGQAIVYGDLARVGTRTERFLPGALGADVGALDILLNVAHDRGRVLARTGGGGLVLTDTPTALEVRAELLETSEATDVLALIGAGILRGLSLEFQALRECMEGATRVIQSARLVGIGVVDKPAYKASTVSARSEAEAVRRASDRHLREFML